MPVKQQGFSLTEVLIAMAISSVLLMSASRFLPALQRSIMVLTKQQALEEDLWLRINGIGKHLQRAGYCAGKCEGEGLKIGLRGECVIVQWDENSNGRWETSPSAAAEQTGIRLNGGALETLRGATQCDVGFAPELSLTLAASANGQPDGEVEAHHIVTGFNL